MKEWWDARLREAGIRACMACIVTVPSEHFRVNGYVLITLDPRNIGEDHLIDIQLGVLDRPLYMHASAARRS